MEYVKTIAALLFLPLAYGVVYFFSSVHTLASVDSPDDFWTSSVRERVYASIFSAPEFCVTLQSNKDWVHLTRGEEIFVIEKNAISQPKLEWRSRSELVITLAGKVTAASLAGHIRRQLTQYKDIKISYTMVAQ